MFLAPESAPLFLAQWCQARGDVDAISSVVGSSKYRQNNYKDRCYGTTWEMIPSGRTSFFLLILKTLSKIIVRLLYYIFYFIFLITFRSLRSRLIIMYTFIIWTLGTGHRTHHDFTQPERNIGFPRNCGARGFIEDEHKPNYPNFNSGMK